METHKRKVCGYVFKDNRICGLTFADSELYDEHFAQHSKPKIRCTHLSVVNSAERCPKEYANSPYGRRDMKEHVNWAHLGIGVKCTDCPQIFSCRKRMLGHRKKIHDTNRATVKCKLCGKEYSSVENLRKHRVEDHGGDMYTPRKKAAHRFFSRRSN
jgi:hypothetical protein